MFTRKYKIKQTDNEFYNNPYYERVNRKNIYTNNNYDFSIYNTLITNTIFSYFSDLITLCDYLVKNNDYRVYNLGNSNGIFEYILRRFFCIDSVMNIGKKNRISKLSSYDINNLNMTLTQENKITMDDLELEYSDHEKYYNSVCFLINHSYNNYDYDNFINLKPVMFMISLNLNNNNKFKDLLITEKGYPKEEVIIGDNIYKLSFYYKLDKDKECYNLLTYELDKDNDIIYEIFFQLKKNYLIKTIYMKNFRKHVLHRLIII